MSSPTVPAWFLMGASHAHFPRGTGSFQSNEMTSLLSEPFLYHQLFFTPTVTLSAVSPKKSMLGVETPVSQSGVVGVRAREIVFRDVCVAPKSSPCGVREAVTQCGIAQRELLLFPASDALRGLRRCQREGRCSVQLNELCVGRGLCRPRCSSLNGPCSGLSEDAHSLTCAYTCLKIPPVDVQ